MSAHTLGSDLCAARRSVERHSPTRSRSFVVGSVVLLAFALFAPLFRGGTLLLLDSADYPVGPRPTIGTYAYGFQPGLTSRAPVKALLLALVRAVPFDWATVIPFVLVPILVAMGFWRLLHRRPLGVVAATLVMSANPFIDDRLAAGQVYLGLGYALLPLLLSLVLEARAWRTWAAAGALLALMIALSPHLVFIGGCVVVAGSLARRGARRTVRGAAVLVTCAVLLSLYWLVPIVSRAGALEVVGSADLTSFATRGDPAFGLGANVAGLFGFWRPGPPTTKDLLPAWPLVLIALLVVVAIGAREGRRSERGLTHALVALGVAGFMLSLGADGPTAPIYRILFEHLPGFRIMREPAKFESLLALAYAGSFGLGIEAVIRGVASRRARPLVTVALLAVPCLFGIAMFWGFHGYARPSPYPASWSAAESIMGPGSGKILALPGDQYVSFPWTQGRSVASPMDAFFSRDVLIDGALDLDAAPSQTQDAMARYLAFVTEHGDRTQRFGELVAPLGVRYVLLSHTEDWRRYGWLDDQSDLHLVHRWSDLALYENLERVRSAFVPSGMIRLPDWGAVVGAADTVDLDDLAVIVAHAAPGPVRPPVAAPAAGVTATTIAVRDRSPVEIDLATSAPSVVLDERYDPSWRLGEAAPETNLGVTLRFEDADPTAVRYERWTIVRASYLASALVALALVIGIVVSRRRSGSRGTPSRRVGRVVHLAPRDRRRLEPVG